jgi:NADPH:quinone reductase
MAAVVIATAYGGPEVLTLTNSPTPEPGAGEAVIEVRAAGINPADYKTYSGAFGRDPDRLPLRLGFEAAGVVIAAGPDAIGPAGPIAIGDEVIAFRASGAYASELLVPAQSLVPKPASLDWTQASGLMLTGATAWHCLVATGVGEGDTVLVHGGSGGVGSMAVQLAVSRGATVVATGSPARHALLAELGATPVNYGPGLAERVRGAAPDGVDSAIDLIGTDEAVDVSVELVADRQRIATIAAFGRAGDLGIKALGGGPGADPGTQVRDGARLSLAQLAGDGRLRVIVSESFPLDRVADAHRAIMSGHSAGKTVLIP